MTIPRKLLENGQTMPGRPAYFVKGDGTWRPTTWAEYADQVRSAAKSLIALGVEPGDAVNILGFNRPEWVIMDVAAMAAGAVPAGIYTTNSPSECRYIIGHSEAPVVLVENEEQWQKIAQVRDQLPALRHIVVMAGTEIDDDVTLSWDRFMAAGEDVPDDQIEARLDALQPDGLATLIYTSGTTGPPKGVMLSHDNLVWTLEQIIPSLGIDSGDRVLSYLPLSHIAEQDFSIHAAVLAGFSVYYAESIEALPENLKEVRPTLFFAVPRVWERFHAGVTARLAEAEGAKAKIAGWAMSVARKVNAGRMKGREPSGLLGIQYRVADKIVLSKVKAALGLDDVKVALSGAAPVSPEILEFFTGLDILVYEVYGQSEDTGPTTINLPGRTKLGSVGSPWPGVEVKIADDGEVLVKGRNVFLGYYRNPEATAETLVDGWLHSGDLGEFDEEGYLHITGRKKDIIITAGGKNVAPAPMESSLKNHVLVSEAIVIGDRRKFLSVLISLDFEAAEKFLADSGKSGEAAHESAEIVAELQRAVDDLNRELARVEQIKKFVVLGRQLTIEDGELTPTLKVKRVKVSEHFASEIDALYAE